MRGKGVRHPHNIRLRNGYFPSSVPLCLLSLDLLVLFMYKCPDFRHATKNGKRNFDFVRF
jgi:hypothetical protein